MATIKSIFGFSPLKVAKTFPSLWPKIFIPKGTVEYIAKANIDSFRGKTIRVINKSKFSGYVEHNTRANLLKQKKN